MEKRRRIGRGVLKVYMMETSKAKSTESIEGQGGNSAGNEVLSWAAA